MKKARKIELVTTMRVLITMAAIPTVERPLEEDELELELEVEVEVLMLDPVVVANDEFGTKLETQV